MDTDAALVAGLVLICVAMPSVVAAFAESRRPRGGAVMMVAALGLIGWAFLTRPGGYTLAEIPLTIYAVLGRMLN